MKLGWNNNFSSCVLINVTSQKKWMGMRGMGNVKSCNFSVHCYFLREMSGTDRGSRGKEWERIK